MCCVTSCCCPNKPATRIRTDVPFHISLSPFVYIHLCLSAAQRPVTFTHLPKLRNHGMFLEVCGEPGHRLKQPARVLCLHPPEQKQWAGIYVVWIHVTLFHPRTDVNAAENWIRNGTFGASVCAATSCCVWSTVTSSLCKQNLLTMH